MTNSEQDLSLEEIETKISSLTLLKSEKIAQLEEKKSKKEKKKAKSGKLDVKVPKGTKGTSSLLVTNERLVWTRHGYPRTNVQYYFNCVQTSWRN